jgi:drug/metabolite transporter (DMT)-like permease
VIAALFPVTTVLLARLILGERISTTQRAGAIAALAGVALIAA